MDFGGPLDVPSKVQVEAVATRCVQAAVAPTGAARVAWDEMPNWPPHVDPVTGECIMNQLYLPVKGPVHLE